MLVISCLVAQTMVIVLNVLTLAIETVARYIIKQKCRKMVNSEQEQNIVGYAESANYANVSF
ncbi:hypothetical protein EB118_15150 [bacterium]|nr:hypothetical protein [bacterium]